MSRIIADAFGGDNAPLAVLQGAVAARDEYGVEIILTGSREKIERCAAENGLSLDGIEICDVPEVVSMHDDPSVVIKAKKETSSMGAGLCLLAEGKGDAFISAGSTGALMMGATFIAKRKKGIKRGAIATVMPAKNGPTVILDSGANSDCRPEMLHQFAHLGRDYAERVLGISSPRIGLLNIGTEDTKGDELRLETYKLLSEDSELNFVGNIEARAIPDSLCDVLVCDGFSGNIAIKSIEGTAAFIMSLLKKGLYSSFRTKIGAILAKPGLRQVKRRLDYSELGGAPILGISKPVIKAHGSSDAKAIKNAFNQAKKASEGGLCD